MKLFLVLVVLLFEVPADAVRPPKCFSNITGYCRKKCRTGEVYDIQCPNRKLCCVSERENKKYQEAQESFQSSMLSDQKQDYAVLPTVTLGTAQI
ncbi:beta-defensin 128 [Saccopteryx bilineata]|uniref:beta-defensin 128 n=1 Tax=Saccopteryx bilineata TaxID=59482 RepID=UPI00338DA309